MIKLLGVQNYKGGVRISMLCGFRALEDYEKKSEILKQLSMLLSTPENEVFHEINRLKDELSAQKWKMEDLQMQLLKAKVGSLPNEQLVIMFETDLSGNAPRELVNLLLEKDIEVGAVFCGNDVDGYRYVIGSRKKDVRTVSKILNEKFQGRGGGKPEMVQGSLCGEKDEIQRVMKNMEV